MQQLILPAVQQAIDSLQVTIDQDEKEIVQFKETLKAKKKQIRDWKKAIRAINGQGPAPRKKKTGKGG